jgi:hypothetical protein
VLVSEIEARDARIAEMQEEAQPLLCPAPLRPALRARARPAAAAAAAARKAHF